jgi:hypothetical protein
MRKFFSNPIYQVLLRSETWIQPPCCKNMYENKEYAGGIFTTGGKNSRF